MSGRHRLRAVRLLRINPNVRDPAALADDHPLGERVFEQARTKVIDRDVDDLRRAVEFEIELEAAAMRFEWSAESRVSVDAGMA